MTGQIAGPSIFSLELVGFVIGVSMIIGAADLIRQPGWAWKRAEENKAAYLVLVLLLPLVGLGIYLYAARPKVAPITAAGRAASLPFERFGTDADQKHAGGRPAGRDQRTSGGVRQLRGHHASATGRAWCSTPDRPTGRPRRRSAPPSSAPEEPPPGPPGHPSAWPGPTGPGSAPASPRSDRGQAGGPRRVEGRPHRPAPVPLLGRFPVDRERRRRGRADQGLGQLLVGAGAAPSARPGDQPAQPGHQHLEHGLAGQHGGAPEVEVGLGQKLDGPGDPGRPQPSGLGQRLLGRERAADARGSRPPARRRCLRPRRAGGSGGSGGGGGP